MTLAPSASYVDDVHGYDFGDDDGTPQDTTGHGSHVAGIIGARGGLREVSSADAR